MAVRIRLKKMGRKARPFFRLCAVDSRNPRDGKVIEELGYYDPMVRDTDARAILKSERIDYWLSVGAQPSEKAGVLIKKYGTDGTHLDQQKAALEKLKAKRKPAAAPAASVEAPAADETSTETSPPSEEPQQEPVAAADSSEETPSS